MQIATIRTENGEEAALALPNGVMPLRKLNDHLGRSWPCDSFDLISSGGLQALSAWYRAAAPDIPDDMAIGEDAVRYAPLYRHPRKIWGIGLNYADHAADLSEQTPTGIPGSFMKPDTTIIGHGDTIEIPLLSQKTTAEAELGIIIGTTCRNVPVEDWQRVVAGFTTIIDMTAEDILRRNPRYLTVSKSFDTFFSFGPQMVTPGEIADISALEVATVVNGKVRARNVVANMTFSPAFLVSFLSQVMTLVPGDIISTGTPGAWAISEGDTVECRIDGFHPLTNPVADRKIQGER
jgi:2-keto-4-pentenoate hydratase/2-oxohepta-3-ene-1,7-dioic acid hydratase in catechol pathway